MLSSIWPQCLLLLLLTHSSYSIDVQRNYSICNWARLRAGSIRDAIYLDGGQLWWQTAFADGSTPVVASDGNVAGDMWRLNLSRPFDTTRTNLSALLDTMPKAGGAGNNIAPNYIDGTMFVNDNELYFYGGLPRLTDSVTPQSQSSVLGYEAYQYGPQRDSWAPGFYQGNLDDNVTRYITNGAGASAPSENLGFYFSGMRSADWGPIYYEEANANETANTLIEVDTSVMRSEDWSNNTLPDEITTRADAELVWLPVSQRGVLVAIGGVTAPEEVSPMGLDSSQSEESQRVSPTFMTSIPVHDIESRRWFVQNTTGSEAPSQLTSFCSVVATNEDASVINIYIYGGYDGLNSGDVPSDDVWVLSIPSFRWVKAYSGTPSHGRSGHRCLSPYPDKMLVIGGIHQNQAQCVEGGFIQVFNLNTLEFQNEYDPDAWEPYNVPDVVSAAIGGNQKRQTQWSDPALGDIFSTKYTKEITHYYPFKSDGSNSDDGDGNSGNNSSKTIAIAVGVAGAVVFLLLCIVVLLVVRRRHIMRSNASASESTGTRQSRISRWVNGTRGAPGAALKHHNDSVSSLGPETQQIDFSHPYRKSDSDPPTPPFMSHNKPIVRAGAPQEMAAVERPLPPFELATPYNQEEHPRHSNRISFNYSASKGHSPSRSTSSEYDRLDPIQEHSPIASTTHLHPADAYHPTQGHPNKASTSSSSSTSSTLAWPLPGSRPNWSRTPSSENTHPHPHPEPVPPIPHKYHNYQNYRSLADDTPPDRLQPIPSEGDPSSNSNSNSHSNSYTYSDASNQKVSSVSSTSPPPPTSNHNYNDDRDRGEIESLPSPETSLPPAGTKHGDDLRNDLRRSLFQTVESGMVSPISPDNAAGPGWKSVWGYGAQQGPTSSRPEVGRRRASGEAQEGWWIRS